jgi:hypothetical protein
MFKLLAVAVSLVLAQAVIPDPVTYLTTYATAAAATLFLGAAKKYTTIADTAIGKAIKPVQPWLVMGLSILLPRLIHGTPNVPDPGALAAAPTATLLMVGAAEIIRRLFPAPPR